MGKLMIFGIIIIMVVSIFAAQLGLTVSGGIDGTDELPTTSVWDVVTESGGAFLDFMGFAVPNLGVISVFFWFIAIMEFVCIMYFIRGTN